MEKDELINEITQREYLSGLFDITINNLSVYNFISRYVLGQVLDYYNCGLNYKSPNVSNKERKNSLRKSFWQFTRLFVQHKKYKTVIRSFERVDFINGNYVDKFTDPLVDYSELGKNCLILEHGRSGRHLTPRCHSDKIIYTDIIYWLAWKFIKYRKKRFYRKHSEKIDLLFSKIESTFPEIEINKDTLLTIIVRFCFITSCYKRLFKKINAKRLFAPARASFKHIIPAAKMQGLKVYELQHGLTYNKSLTYSGYHDPLFTPDFFLSFGKIPSPECYGITKDRIIEIGWGFEKYLNHYRHEKGIGNFDKKSVLIISDPHISETMVSLTCSFAEKHPEILFSFRAHPLEILSSDTLQRMKIYDNIIINDNLENIFITLTNFDRVMGENSTVLYEALAMGKNVGRINMNGLEPKYINEEDKKYFYTINDDSSFTSFVNSPLGTMPSFSMYSPFRPNVVNALLE